MQLKSPRLLLERSHRIVVLSRQLLEEQSFSHTRLDLTGTRLAQIPLKTRDRGGLPRHPELYGRPRTIPVALYVSPSWIATVPRARFFEEIFLKPAFFIKHVSSEVERKVSTESGK